MGLYHEINDLLQASGHRLSKDFGQHFLTEETFLASMTKAAKLERSDLVVEIGAGIGVLTKHLLTVVDRVISIEVDTRWVPLLEQYVGSEPLHDGRLTLIRADALKTPFPTEPYKIVANIPYQITSPLMRHAFSQPTTPTSITILIQKEVADKMCGKEDRGMLTIMTELFGTATFVRNVPPGAFLPPPAVDSAIIHIERYKEPLGDASVQERVLELASLAFAGRRKMLRKTLGEFRDTTEWITAAGIDPQRRPETLSITEWVELAKSSLKNA